VVNGKNGNNRSFGGIDDTVVFDGWNAFFRTWQIRGTRIENALVNSVTAPFPLIMIKRDMRELLFKDNHVLMAGRRA